MPEGKIPLGVLGHRLKDGNKKMVSESAECEDMY
jgi:hypothetical protein